MTQSYGNLREHVSGREIDLGIGRGERKVVSIEKFMGGTFGERTCLAGYCGGPGGQSMGPIKWLENDRPFRERHNWMLGSLFS